ncbi:hypothetical protein ABIB25_005174 [Nakamurella sp. UYEF19]|uniref:hypothetical protein n=1 Tax=Nakamurella sp. UYEF19 TaxID=1756392 RepID=UPI003398D3DD
MKAVRSFVTHYHRADRRPFLNLSDLAEPEITAVMDELAAPEEHKLSSRRFGPRYMALRRATECRARDTGLTYADSITALGLGVPLGLPAPDPEHADPVCQLQDLEQLVARFGLPSDAAPQDPAGYNGYRQHPVDAYIEVQLWSDEPVRAHVGRA